MVRLEPVDDDFKSFDEYNNRINGGSHPYGVFEGDHGGDFDNNSNDNCYYYSNTASAGLGDRRMVAGELARQLAAETIQNFYRTHLNCRPAMRIKRLSAEERLVQNIAADVIKSTIRRLSRSRNRSGNSTPRLEAEVGSHTEGTAMSGARSMHNNELRMPSGDLSVLGVDEALFQAVLQQQQEQEQEGDRRDMGTKTSADGSCIWVDIDRITAENLVPVSWDGKLDPYIEVNGSKSSIAWNTSLSKVTWSKLHRSIAVESNESELYVKLFDANIARNDVLIADCSVNIRDLVEKCRKSDAPITSTLRSHLVPVHGNTSNKTMFIELTLRVARGPAVPTQVDGNILESHKKSPPINRMVLTDSIAPDNEPAEPVAPVVQPKVASNPAKPYAPPTRRSSAPSRRAESQPATAAPVQMPDIGDLRVEVVPLHVEKKKEVKQQVERPSAASPVAPPYSGQALLKLDAGANPPPATKSAVTVVPRVPVPAPPKDLERKHEPRVAKPAPAPKPKVFVPEDRSNVKVGRTDTLPKVKVTSPMDYIVKKQIVYSAFYIDKAFVDAVQAELVDRGVYLTCAEAALTYEALGYGRARAPGLPLVIRSADGQSKDMEAVRKALEETTNINIAFSGKQTSSFIAQLLNYLAQIVDFGLDEDISECTAAGKQLITQNDGGIVMRNLISLALGVWNRVRTFILMVCNVIPDNGGGRPSEWGPSWVTRFAKKLELPTDKFGMVSGQKLLHMDWNSFCDEFGVGPSLLRVRFRVYQHVLRLLDKWWEGDVPLRPDDKIRPLLEVSGNVSGYGKPEKISAFKPMQNSLARMKLRAERQQAAALHPPPLSARSEDGEDDANPQVISNSSSKLAPGDPVTIAPRYILYPVLCDIVDKHALGLNDDRLEYFASVIGERKGTISGTPYGLQTLSGMSWVVLRPQPEESSDRMSQIVNNMDLWCAPGILNSGRHVLVPTTCLAKVVPEIKVDISHILQRSSESDEKRKENKIKSIMDSYVDPGHMSFNDLRFGLNEDLWSNRLSAAQDTTEKTGAAVANRDDFDTVEIDGGDESMPIGDLGEYPGRETYIGGARGARGAVVTAPLPESLPDRRPKTVGRIRPKRKPEPSDKSNAMSAHNKTNEKSSENEPRSLFRPAPVSGSEFAPDSLRRFVTDGSTEAIEILQLLSKDVEKKASTQKLKEEVKISVHRFDELGKDVNQSINNQSTDKKPARPKTAGQARASASNAAAPKSNMQSKIMNDIEKSEAIDKFLTLLDNVHNLDELQAISDSIAGAKRRLSASKYSPVRSHAALKDPGIIESFLKFKMSQRKQREFLQESKEAWGKSRSEQPRPRSASPAPRDAGSRDGGSRSPHRKQLDFPWMIGAAAGDDAPDPIEQRENEKLWRSLKLAERETIRREAHLKREIKKLGGLIDEHDMNFVTD